jgi:sulfur carrier protein
MTVVVNNKETETQCATLAELLESLGMPEKGVAVAVNNVVVARTQWQLFRLEPLQRITVLKAFCGG